MSIDADRLAAVVVKAIATVTTPIVERVRSLEAGAAAVRKEIDERPARLDYQGAWREGTVYKRHQAVSRQGALWICTSDSTMSAPKFNHGGRSDWALVQKQFPDPRGDRQ